MEIIYSILTMGLVVFIALVPSKREEEKLKDTYINSAKYMRNKK